jgi:2-polyprenyl-6-methoxyphenol hydroxylase-like FAD-dependent oxidoreductase
MPTDVLITGAGPVGLAAAIELSRFGLTVRIIDKAPERTDKSKALVVWSRTLELLDRSGCSPALLSAGRICTTANLMSGAKNLAHISFEGVDSPHPYALMIPQSETERVLDEHLQTLGIHVERSVELTAFTQSDSGVICNLTQPNGVTETVEASWLLACDGAHSTIRHQLNLPFDGATLPSEWMLADVHLHGMPNPEELHIFLHEAGVLAIFPIGMPGETPRARVIANLGDAQPGQPRPEPTLADTQAILDQRGPGNVTASDPVWLANFGINERKIRDYRVNRIFLAGDAAHIHSPAGGQGMNTGIQDACNLAWKLALVHRGLCKPEPLLDSYSAERSPIAEQVLKSTGQLTAIGTMHNEALLAIRNTAAKLILGFTSVKRALAGQLTELAVAYPESPLNTKGTPPNETPTPGDRAPIRAGESPVGAGNTPRFALYAAPGPNADQFIACFPDLLEPQPREPFTPGSLCLVRPDGYVVFAADLDAWPQADAYMVNLIYGPKQKVRLYSE